MTENRNGPGIRSRTVCLLTNAANMDGSYASNSYLVWDRCRRYPHAGDADNRGTLAPSSPKLIFKGLPCPDLR